MPIDTTFDFRSDARGGDPDQYSPTLRAYHQLLWSKRLPSGHRFDLDATTPGGYLHHESELGEFWLGSDSVIHSFSYWQSMQHVIAEIPRAEVQHFEAMGSTIGGMMIFPNNKVDGKMTINGARGMNSARIADRMDLTLECIRRYYRGDTRTPLGAVLARYADFFSLFDDFTGYVDFFLLQDLVTADYEGVHFFLPFETFDTRAVPGDVPSYVEYRERSIQFIHGRNQRIQSWVSDNLET